MNEWGDLQWSDPDEVLEEWAFQCWLERHGETMDRYIRMTMMDCRIQYAMGAL